jgi:rRNA small subunit pseudouridine methyltransferase Nep1
LLSFVLAESALELAPKEVWRAPAVQSDAKRRGVDPSRILLDRSFHHSAMLKLKDGEKRGRPDLVHVALLSITGTPLYLDGNVKVYAHTCADMVLELAEGTRIPKSYLRFRGLAEKLLSEEPDEGLVRVYRRDIASLVRKTIAADEVYGLSTQGGQATLRELAHQILSARRPCVIVGGFPRGHFSPQTLGTIDRLARIHPRPLEAQVVIARLAYEIERELAPLND